MAINKQTVVEALSTIRDPQTGQDIVSVKMVQNLVIEGDNITFSIVTSNKDSNVRSSLVFDTQAILQKLYPKAIINVHLADAGSAPEPGSAPPQNAIPDVLPHVKNVIAVASGKGGVGKSTVSVNLALALKKQGFRVGLLDADLYGPSIPGMMGIRKAKPSLKEIYGKQKIVPLEAHGISTISIGFLVEQEQAVVLRGPRLAGILKQFIEEVIWPELDYLVIDLPPGTGDIQLTLVQTVPVTGVVMVTTPQIVAVDDAYKAANMFRLSNVKVPIIGVVENMSWFTPEELPENKYFLFGQGGGEKLAEFCETKLVGQIPIVQSVREGGDNGTPIVLKEGSIPAEAFSDMARNIHSQVEERNKNIDPTKVVEIIHQ